MGPLREQSRLNLLLNLDLKSCLMGTLREQSLLNLQLNLNLKSLCLMGPKSAA